MVSGEPWLRRTARAMASLLLVVGSLATGCMATVEPHPPVHLEVAGSTSMEPLLEELASAYSDRYDYVTTNIEARGTRLGLEAFVIARDAIAILVNSQNPVDSLTLGQVTDIFSGDIVAWSEVGGEEADIQVLSREDGSGTREAFEELVMQGQRVTLAAIVMPGSSAVGDFVADNPTTIGYASAAGIPLGARALRIDGFLPDLETLSQDEYPLTRRFVLVTIEDPGEDVESFLDFVLSPAGQVIVGRRYGRAG
jgi:phosphate transport system substrate-binding protein